MRVLQVVEELGFRPNQLARSLRQRATRTVGLIITDILNLFHATVAKGVQDSAFRHGYNLILGNTDEDPGREKTYLDTFISYQLQGLVIVPTARTRVHLRSIGHVPVVEVDRTSGYPNAHAVLVDNIKGTLEAIGYLVRLGHRRIGTIAGKSEVTTGAERLEGYMQAMRDAELAIDPRWVVHSDHREDGGYRAARGLLDLPAGLRPTALFIVNNEAAAGAVRATRELGFRIPEDISLVSFDDARWAQLMDPPLTVVEQPAYEMGLRAGEMLFQSIETGGESQAILRLAPRLIVRGSTAAPT